MPTLDLGDIKAELIQKDIKNIHLSVYPPFGHVRVAIPQHMTEESARAYVATKIPWIRRQQKRILSQEREPIRNYVPGESHYLWGKRYLLRVTEGRPNLETKGSRINLTVKGGASREDKEQIFERWHRKVLAEFVEERLPDWEDRMGVTCDKVLIRRMRTKWGSCTHSKKTIRLNTELVKKPKDCVEYVLVHELAHLLVPNHSGAFIDLMDKCLPSWRERRNLLNSLPVRHERWGL